MSYHCHIILDFRMVSVFPALRGETGHVMLRRNALIEEVLLEEIAREAMVCAVYVSIKIKCYLWRIVRMSVRLPYIYVILKYFGYFI